MKRNEWIVISTLVAVTAICMVTAACSKKPKAPADKPVVSKPVPPPTPPDTSKVAKQVKALVSATPKAIAVSADGSVVLAACDSAAHDTGSSPGLYVSQDHGATWATNNIEQIWRGAAMSADGKYMAASAQKNAGVWVSSDHGATWVRTHDKSSWALAMSADGKILVSGGDPGPISVSSDYGQTWTTVMDSKLSWTGIAVSADGTKIAAVAYAEASFSEDGKKIEDAVNQPIYESADGGATWTKRESARRWMAIRMSSDGTRQVAVAASADVWISDDGGATWKSRTQGNMNASRVAMSGDGKRIVTGAEGGSEIISYSTDGGETWKNSPFAKPTFAIGMSADGTHVFCGYLHTYRLDLEF